MIFDFHCHLTVKPYNSVSINSDSLFPPDRELWLERFLPKESSSSLKEALAKEINTTSQLHLDSVETGNVRCICSSLYPLERVFTLPTPSGLARIFGFILKSKGTSSKTFSRFAATLAGYDIRKIEQITAGQNNYYADLEGEYTFLINNQNRQRAGRTFTYAVARNFREVNQIIRKGQLAVIHTVEGLSCFLGVSGEFHYKNFSAATKTKAIATIKANVIKYLNKDFPPFIITVAHHQYNFLMGHSPSFAGFLKGVADQKGKDGATSYFKLGISKPGMDILRIILSRKTGKHGRTLIDTKHMSRKARKQYHAFVKKSRAAGDPIPIIQTHTAVNGRSWTNIGQESASLDLPAHKRAASPFNTGSINAYNEEIVDIVNSDGLIGIMLDEKRLMGIGVPADTGVLALSLKKDPTEKDPDIAKGAGSRIQYAKQRLRLKRHRAVMTKRKILEERRKKQREKLERRLRRLETEVQKLRAEFLPVELSILINQFFHIVTLTGKKGWDHICLGSDYEGTINPIDGFFYSENLSDLETGLVDLWKFGLAQTDPKFNLYKTLVFDKTPEFYIEKVLWSNSQDFLKKYFTKAYRMEAV